MPQNEATADKGIRVENGISDSVWVLVVKNQPQHPDRD
jgi:hypothetical protein